jgi:ketosteroid isomerase-like protein
MVPALRFDRFKVQILDLGMSMRFASLLLALAAPAFASGADIAPTPGSNSRDPQSVANELLAADRAFSAQAANRPIPTALPAMFDDAVIMPLPTGNFATGKEAVAAALAANPANLAAKANWAPVRAGVSADGSQGFTYGFMAIREEGKPDRRAKYLAYWIKGSNGWRVAAYKRAGSGAGDVQTELRPAALPTQLIPPTANAATIEAHRASLAATERAFSDRAQQIGLGPAFAEFGSEDAMNMGREADFTFSNRAIAAGMPPDPKSPLIWAPDQGTLVASSGDLGVTWGYIRPLAPPPPGQLATIPFFTVWHRATPQAPWRYIAE